MHEGLKAAIFYSRESYLRGLVGGTGGNTSVRIGDDVYISATSAALGNLAEEDFVKVPIFDGQYESARIPSKELSMHMAIYKERPDIGAVLHLHPANTIAATLLLDRVEDEIPCYSQGYFVKIGHMPQVPFYLAGSAELAAHVSSLFKEVDCVLLRNHGLIVGGKTLESAFTRTEEIESNSKLHLTLKGKNALSEEQLAQISAALKH